MIDKLVVFFLVSVCLAYISRESIKLPRTHGFYRFFAWECILALFLLNFESWFENPFSLIHVLSWLFLIVSAYLIIEAVYRLRQFGELDKQRKDIPLVGIEKTTNLVTNGVYRYIRHPMYSSLLFLAWGIFFKSVSWRTGILVVAASVFLLLTALRDEEESLRFFGPTYQEYRQRTRMFIPFIF